MKRQKITDFPVGDTLVTAHFSGEQLSLVTLRHAKQAATLLAEKLAEMEKDLEAASQD